MFSATYWNISFSDDGLAELNSLLDNSLGKYFEKIEPQNHDRPDLWSAPDLKEMPQFILGHVVAQIAIALRKSVGSGQVNKAKMMQIGPQVMHDKTTEEYCAFMLSSYHKKVAPAASATPICEGVYLQAKPSEPYASNERPSRDT